MLEGIRVVELGQNVAGPYASAILADLGAEVIKVEKPGGEEGRKLGPPFVGGDPAWFHQVNKNKKSVVVDIKDPADLARLLGIIASADVFIHNMRPGSLAAYGLDADALRARFPRLIYADIGAFGRVGPMAARPGYELLMQAFGGLMSITGGEDAPPTRAGPSMVDLGTGMWTAIGVLAALLRRAATGEGCSVQSSLFESAIGFSAIHMVNYIASGQMPARTTNGFAGLAPYGGFPTRSGDIIVAAGNDGLFQKLAELLGHPEWKQDPLYRSNADRVANKENLNRLVAEALRGEDAATWLQRLEAAGIPCAPIKTIPELIADPQTAALGMIGRLPGEGGAAVVGLPLSFDGVRPAVRSGTPRPGEHDAALANATEHKPRG